MNRLLELSKIFTFVLALILIVTFAGCDASTSTNGTNNTQSTEASSKTTSVCNHTYVEATCENAKKCTLCGETFGNALGHSYSNATCTEAKKCSRCGATSDSALEHDWVNATCQTPKKCTRCGVTEGSKAQHNMNNQGMCSSCGKDVFSQFVKENFSIRLIVPSIGASDNYYCEVEFVNHTGYNITLNSHVFANGKGCSNLKASNYILETDYSIKIPFYRAYSSIVVGQSTPQKYRDMYLDNNSTATTSIEINGRHANVRFGANGTINIENTY